MVPACSLTEAPVIENQQTGLRNTCVLSAAEHLQAIVDAHIDSLYEAPLCCECISIRLRACIHTNICVYVRSAYMCASHAITRDVTQMTSWNLGKTEFNQRDSAYFRQLQRRRGNVCYRGADDNLNSAGLHWTSTKGHLSRAIQAHCMPSL